MSRKKKLKTILDIEETIKKKRQHTNMEKENCIVTDEMDTLGRSCENCEQRTLMNSQTGLLKIQNVGKYV